MIVISFSVYKIFLINFLVLNWFWVIWFFYIQLVFACNFVAFLCVAIKEKKRKKVGLFVFISLLDSLYYFLKTI